MEGQREANKDPRLTPPEDIHNRYPSAGRPIGNGKFKCDLCGAIKTDFQIGLESTPEEFIEELVAVCREVKRVLRSDGTFFFNIGDSYASGGGDSDRLRREHVRGYGDIKNKDMIGIPWMAAFALRADGWYLRSEIIWGKNAPMPESVIDRATIAHEKIFMLTKSPKYFFDGYAVEEPAISLTLSGNDFVRPQRLKFNNPDGSSRGNQEKWNNIGGLRNIRSVWMLGPENKAEFHFATFPSEVPRRCILSGVGRKGVCAKCGAPWRRDTKINIYQPTCDCNIKETIPGIVLDPFLGSGTTAMVANALGHDCIGIELSPDNAKGAYERIRGDGRFFKRSVIVDNGL